jgi:hypothetical protein
MELPSPCQPLKVEAIKTKSIKIPTPTGIQEYRYIESTPTPRFFEYRPELKAYVELYNSHPMYDTLLESI